MELCQQPVTLKEITDDENLLHDSDQKMTDVPETEQQPLVTNYDSKSEEEPSVTNHEYEQQRFATNNDLEAKQQHLESDDIPETQKHLATNQFLQLARETSVDSLEESEIHHPINEGMRKESCSSNDSDEILNDGMKRISYKSHNIQIDTELNKGTPASRFTTSTTFS